MQSFYRLTFSCAQVNTNKQSEAILLVCQYNGVISLIVYNVYIIMMDLQQQQQHGTYLLFMISFCMETLLEHEGYVP